MGQSGNTILFGLDGLALLLLLLAAGAVLVRHPFTRNSRAFLLAWLLILLFSHSTRMFSFFTPDANHWPDALWLRFLNFLAAALFFSTVLTKPAAVFFSYLLVAYLSACSTVYLTSSLPVLHTLSFAGQWILAALILTNLIQLARQKSLYFLQSPLFWLLAGSLFVLVMEGGLAALTVSGLEPLPSAEDREALIRFFAILQYAFFAAGLWTCRIKPPEEQGFS